MNRHWDDVRDGPVLRYHNEDCTWDKRRCLGHVLQSQLSTGLVLSTLDRVFLVHACTGHTAHHLLLASYVRKLRANVPSHRDARAQDSHDQERGYQAKQRCKRSTH